MKLQFGIVIYVTFLSCSCGQLYNMTTQACPNITDNSTTSEYIQSLLCTTTNMTNWNLPPEFQNSGIVSCFIDSYSELIGTIIQSMTNISADQNLQIYFHFLSAVCMEKTNFSRCVLDRTENSTNMIDVIVLKFINVSNLDHFLDILCNISESIENPLACFQILGMQASYCSSLYYGNLTNASLTGVISNNYTVTELIDMYQDFICPGLQSTVDCTSIGASLCKPDISSYIKEITSLILTNECSLSASNASQASNMNPIASVFVQCGMPFYVSIASSFMTEGTGDISILCSHLELYMDCLDTRLRTSNNFLDKLILQFLDKSKIGDFKNITVGICNYIQDSENSTSCLRTLVGTVPMCASMYLRHVVNDIGLLGEGVSYGDGFSSSIQDLTSIIGLLGMNDIETSKDNICMLLPFISDCISIHVSTCSPSAGSLIRNMPDRIFTEECKNPNENTTARHFVQSDPVSSVLIHCGLPVLIQMFSGTAGFSGNMADVIYTSFNIVCSLGEWYMSCVNSRLSESVNRLDKFFQEIIDFSKVDATRIIEIVCNTLNVDREKMGCLINAVTQDMNFHQCLVNTNLTVWNGFAFFYTPMTGSYIRSTYCPSISGLILCAKEAFSVCDSNIDTLLHVVSSIMFEECQFTWLNDTLTTPSIETNVTEIIVTQSSDTGNGNVSTRTGDITTETSSLFQDSTSSGEFRSTNSEGTTTDTRLPSVTTYPFSTDTTRNEHTQNIVEQTSVLFSEQHTTETTITTTLSSVVSSTDSLTTMSPETTTSSTRGISTSPETSSMGKSTFTATEMSSVKYITTPETIPSSTRGVPTSTETKTSSTGNMATSAPPEIRSTSTRGPPTSPETGMSSMGVSTTTETKSSSLKGITTSPETIASSTRGMITSTVTKTSSTRDITTSPKISTSSTRGITTSPETEASSMGTSTSKSSETSTDRQTTIYSETTRLIPIISSQSGVTDTTSTNDTVERPNFDNNNASSLGLEFINIILNFYVIAIVTYIL